VDKEPSVLDYLKSLFTFNSEKRDHYLKFLTDSTVKQHEVIIENKAIQSTAQRANFSIPLLVIVCLLIGQAFLSPPVQHVYSGVLFYCIGGVSLVVLLVKQRWLIKESPLISSNDELLTTFNRNAAIAAGIFILLSIVTLSYNTFSILNVTLWILAVVCTVIAFWKPSQTRITISRGLTYLQNNRSITIKISLLGAVLFVTVGFVLFFRTYQLNQVPGEMWSDHAEKLLDVMDVLNGQTSIFFPRNTGREGFQIYLTAFIAKAFGTGVTFLSLKLGTMIAGLIAVFYTYLLGKEYGGKSTGVAAAFLMGIGYWPNIISRVGLRYAIYPLFAAPVLYYLIKGLRTRNINQLIIAGILLGLGMHGYSAFRVMPFLVITGFLLFWLHSKKAVSEERIVQAFLIVVVLSLVLFLPLARYAVENPDMFSYRMLTRLGTTERDYPGSIIVIFFVNLWKSLIMPLWKNGNIWVHSIPDRPALDTVTAVLFFIGFITIIYRYVKTRDWRDLFLLLSIPLLMLPSILSLAFPEENPSLNRSAAAVIPVFLLAGTGIITIWDTLSQYSDTFFRKISRTAFVIGLILISTVNNYDLVFNQYKQQFIKTALNTSEIGQVINNFAGSVGSYDTAYVIPFPHWVDTRLVGINAGLPEKDFALWVDQIPETRNQLGSKLFILKPEDTNALTTLQSAYQNGYFWNYDSKISGKDFLIYFIPAIP